METAEKKRGLPGWAAKLLIWLVPTLALLLLVVFIFGWRLNKETAITFVMLTILGLIITRLIFLFRSDLSGGAKAWRAIVWIILLIVLWFFSLFFPKIQHKYSGVDAKAQFEKAVSELYLPGDGVPSELLIPEEIGSPASTEFHSFRTSALIFESEAYTLLCRYDEAGYSEEKAALETRYSFRTEPLYSEDTTFDKNAKELGPEFDIGNDHFRFIMPNDDHDGYMGDFFKGCSIVVTNDEKHEIAYIVFKDQDLDVADDLTEFVNDTCGWKYVR